MHFPQLSTEPRPGVPQHQTDKPDQPDLRVGAVGVQFQPDAEGKEIGGQCIEDGMRGSALRPGQIPVVDKGFHGEHQHLQCKIKEIAPHRPEVECAVAQPKVQDDLRGKVDLADESGRGRAARKAGCPTSALKSG